MSIADKGTVGLIPVTRISCTTLIGIVKGTERCLPEVATDPKDQVTITATFEKWQTRNHQALAEIILTLKKEPL